MSWTKYYMDLLKTGVSEGTAVVLTEKKRKTYAEIPRNTRGKSKSTGQPH